MGRREENTGFVCANCGEDVAPLTNGSYRNHCPMCLYSKHVDRRLGDRLSRCGGLMRPVALRRSKKGMQILHECTWCGLQRPNLVAERTVQPDNIDALIALSAQHPARRCSRLKRSKSPATSL